MKAKHVKGKAAGDIMLYALSTCIWCGKTKKLLNELGVEYQFIDVDLLNGEEQQAAEEEIRKWNPACSFPTVVINKEKCVVGYKPEELKNVLTGAGGRK